jgi:hypothetical protein
MLRSAAGPAWTLDDAVSNTLFGQCDSVLSPSGPINHTYYDVNAGLAVEFRQLTVLSWLRNGPRDGVRRMCSMQDLGGGRMAVGAGGCVGARRNCELLVSMASSHSERCGELGITDAGALVQAAGVGMVIEVWRNSPVEDMHGGERGPSDAAMFAESTALQQEAVRALTADRVEFGLIGFEKLLLDRSREWAGTGGKTVKQLGHGFLGHYDRHVKDRTNALLSLLDHTCVDEPLVVYLVGRAYAFGRDHKGMPGWRVIVERIGVLLQDPNHPAWWDAERGEQALAEMPPHAPTGDELARVLLTDPWALPVDVLEWLSNYFLYCAGPPYGRSRWKESEH